MPPLKTPTSWYIVRLKERKEPYTPSFNEIIEKIKETYFKVKSRQLAKEAIDAALLKLKSLTDPRESDFAQVAKALDLSSGVTELFKSASYIQGIGASDEFFSVIINLPPDKTSDIITIAEDFYLIKLKQQVPIDEEKFKQEKDAFSRQLTLKMKQMRFMEFLWELGKRAGLKIFRSFMSEPLS
jgi:parvulin-like peptidyl-prolyl isomerase